MVINKPADGKCGYKAFFQSKEIELYADSLYQAKKLAVSHFRPSKKTEHLVSVVLCEIEGQTIVHTADF